MSLRTPRSTRSPTLFPSPTLFRLRGFPGDFRPSIVITITSADADATKRGLSRADIRHKKHGSQSFHQHTHFYDLSHTTPLEYLAIISHTRNHRANYILNLASQRSSAGI